MTDQYPYTPGAFPQGPQTPYPILTEKDIDNAFIDSSSEDSPRRPIHRRPEPIPFAFASRPKDMIPLVEDDFRVSLSNLQFKGHSILTSASGLEAWKCAIADSFSLCDLQTFIRKGHKNTLFIAEPEDEEDPNFENNYKLWSR